MQKPLYCYNTHFGQYCYFDSQATLNRYNFLAIVPNSGGSDFEECDANMPWPSHYEVLPCGTITREMLAPWDFIQEVQGEDGDWVEASNALQPQEVWDKLDEFMFTQCFPLFSKETGYG